MTVLKFPHEMVPGDLLTGQVYHVVLSLGGNPSPESFGTQNAFKNALVLGNEEHREFNHLKVLQANEVRVVTLSSAFQYEVITEE
jgi:hypothetical protein